MKYALLLVILWLLLYVITEYHRFRKKHLLLERFKKSTQECTKELPECRNLLELDYQELLGIFDEKILELKSEARIKGQDLSDYYGMWVHQIKTPIAAARLLLQEEKPRPQEIQNELFKVEQYVAMVLGYLRTEDMASDIRFEEVDMDSLIREQIHKFARIFIGKKLSLEYQEVSETVLTDEKWLGFVLGQILSNALKYTKKGKISIYMSKSRPHTLVIEDTGSESVPKICPGFLKRGLLAIMDVKRTGLLELGFIFAERL